MAQQHAHERHDHLHGHSHAPLDYGRAFAFGIALNLAYVAAEAAAGAISGSLALLADAGHNLGDALALGLSWGAAVLSRRRPSHRFTYGLRSSSILAALANAINKSNVRRSTEESIEDFRRVVALCREQGGANGATALLFARGRERDLNLKSAFLHMGADALVTAGVVASGIAIALTGLYWLDPAVSLVVSAVIVYGTWDLIRHAIGLALDAVPEGVDAAAVRAHLLAQTGVAAIHDLHIWGISTTETALTCHLVMPGGHPGDAALSGIARELEERFGIHHATMQIELGDSDEVCALTPEHVV